MEKRNNDKNVRVGYYNDHKGKPQSIEMRIEPYYNEVHDNYGMNGHNDWYFQSYGDTFEDAYCNLLTEMETTLNELVSMYQSLVKGSPENITFIDAQHAYDHKDATEPFEHKKIDNTTTVNYWSGVSTERSIEEALESYRDLRNDTIRKYKHEYRENSSNNIRCVGRKNFSWSDYESAAEEMETSSVLGKDDRWVWFLPINNKKMTVLRSALVKVGDGKTPIKDLPLYYCEDDFISIVNGKYSGTYLREEMGVSRLYELNRSNMRNLGLTTVRGISLEMINSKAHGKK